MSSRLSDSSYAVLGVIDRLGPATPCQLKQAAHSSLFHFWTIPHIEIYSESGRLAELDLLEERQKETGRRRRTYRLTAAGRAELDRWRNDPHSPQTHSPTLTHRRAHAALAPRHK
jgi:DNA-binding PadR family transcriptional regulator